LGALRSISRRYSAIASAGNDLTCVRITRRILFPTASRHSGRALRGRTKAKVIAGAMHGFRAERVRTGHLAETCSRNLRVSGSGPPASAPRPRVREIAGVQGQPSRRHTRRRRAGARCWRIRLKERGCARTPALAWLRCSAETLYTYSREFGSSRQIAA
jgi:hypothetical protein